MSKSNVLVGWRNPSIGSGQASGWKQRSTEIGSKYKNKTDQDSTNDQVQFLKSDDASGTEKSPFFDNWQVIATKNQVSGWKWGRLKNLK